MGRSAVLTLPNPTRLPVLAQVAVDYLVENLKKTLYLEKEESVPVYELLSVVAAQYNMTAEHYCEVKEAVSLVLALVVRRIQLKVGPQHAVAAACK